MSCISHNESRPCDWKWLVFITFWEQMVPTFNGLQVTGFAPRHVWSLEMKWGVVKHDVAKF